MGRLLLCAVIVSCVVSLSAQTWSCESTTGAYRECRIGSWGPVRLVMEISDRRCFEGLTWGTRQGGIVWVDRGCRATFTIDKAIAGERVVCESLDGKRAVCPAETTHGVGLTRQLSQAACVEGLSWRHEPELHQIWVDQGCRAELTLFKRITIEPKPPVLDSPVKCQSDGKRRTECVADTSGGVQIVRELGDALCRFGHEWGYDERAIWVAKGCSADFVVRAKPKPAVQAIVCESQNNARNHCAADTTFGVALFRKMSEPPCTLGSTWGFDEDGVWVTEGCHAQFALGGYRIPANLVPKTAERVVCESLDGQRKQCPTDAAHGVGLIRQTGKNDCVLNRSWGYAADGIWVSDGCRAEFAVAR
jgi:hypothetical protein